MFIYIFLNDINTYNSLGQLTCIICKITISNEAAWPIHINSKKHKENIENAKQQLEKAKSSVSGQKRSSSTFQEPQPVKKVKGILKNSNSRTTTISQTKSQLPADFFDNKTSTIKSGSLTNGKTNSVKISSNIESSESMIVDEECDDNDDKQLKAKDNASALPEGFFDDPVLDARVIYFNYFSLLLNCFYRKYILLKIEKKILGKKCRVQGSNRRGMGKI